MQVEWNYEKTMEFIKLVHNRPIIWCKGYANLRARDAAIIEIAQQMNTTRSEIHNKLKAMRESCRKEHLRMKTDKDFRPQWKYFHQYRFILNEEKLKEKSTVHQPYKAEELDEIDEVSWLEEKNKSNRLYNKSNIKFEENSNRQYKKMKTTHISNFKTTEFSDDQGSWEFLAEDEQSTVDNKSDIDSYATLIDESDDREESSTLYEEEDVIESAMLKDEFTIFGESIANELRIINNFKSVKLAFKAKVMTAILKANEAVQTKKLECHK